MRKLIILAALIMVFSAVAHADEAVPKTPKPKRTPSPAAAVETNLSIRITPDAKEARLIIPRSQLKQLRAELDGLDGEESPDTAVGFSRAQTIFGGLFLSLAMVFGGVWLSRQESVNKPLVVGAVMFLTGIGATLVFANAGPPQEARSITGKIFSQPVHVYKTAFGKIRLETSDTSKVVELIVPDIKDARPGE